MVMIFYQLIQENDAIGEAHFKEGRRHLLGGLEGAAELQMTGWYTVVAIQHV